MSAAMKMPSKSRVLVVAPGHRGRGGIDSVVRLYQGTPLWDEMSCRMLSTYNDASAPKKILAAIRSYLLAPAALMRADIVHFHLAGEISLLRKIPVLMMAKALRKHVILHVHACGEESLFVKTPRWAWKYSFRAADRVIALSPAWAQSIQKHVPHAWVVIVPNPVKLCPPAKRTRNSIPRVLYVGKLELRKGYDTLLTAAAIVLKEFPQAEFWFAGHGDLPAARAQAEHLGIAPQIRLLGWLTGTELESIYDEGGVFCLPSHNEGVPMSMLEAMSHALPVVCTPVGGVPDIVIDGHNGILVTPGSAESVAAGILRLLRDPTLSDAIGHAGHRTVRETCGLDSVAERMAAVYRDVCAPATDGGIQVGRTT